MAYTDDEFQVVVEGALGPSESWANVWTVLDVVGNQDRQTAADHFHNMYEDIANGQNNTWSAAQATVRSLQTGLGSPAAWESIAGQVATTLLPTQLAVRISLDDANGHRGGPFISGFTEADNDAGGLLAVSRVTSLISNIDTLASDLVTDGFQLRIDRPSITSTVPAARARVGTRFDVIRRRANDTLEDYQSTNLLA